MLSLFDSIESGYLIRKIEPEETRDLILNVHYARRMPPISHAFGLFLDGVLEGVWTFGQPASPRICDGIAGKKWKQIVLELNRLVLRHNRKNEASRLVGAALRMLPRPRIVISYADTAQNHLGIIYQATNWRYYGLSEVRTDRVFIDGTPTKHGRHITSTEVENLHERTKLVPRPRKHRYVHVLADKHTAKQIESDIRYQPQKYPSKNAPDIPVGATKCPKATDGYAAKARRAFDAINPNP